MMEFKITMKEIKDVVKKIDKSVMKKASLPILETVLVKQENNQLAFIASNTEEELHIYKNILVTGNDSFCIALDNLKKIVKLKADVITITYDADDKKVLVSTGKKIVSFVSEWDITSFPLMYIKEPEETWFISRYTSFYEMMEKLSVYLEDADENRKAMTCYNFNIVKNRIVALDGHRIGMCNTSENIGKFNNDSELKEINLKRTFWIKLKNCIAKEINGEQNVISMAGAENKTYITGNDFMMIVRNVDVMYFDVDGMILNDLDLMMVNISTKELKESAEYNVTLYDKYHRKPMYMEFIGNYVMSYMKSQTEESFDRITLTENGVDDGFMIGFNPRFIKDLCNGIDTEFARMGFRDAKSPVMAYDGDFTYLVLPVNINKSDVEERINKLMKLHNGRMEEIIMVDAYGRWIEEKDYSTYPKEKWCDYDYMAAWIREQGYEPKTDMENLISNIFCFYEIEIGDHVSEYDTENGNFDGTYTEAAQAFVMASGGLAEFDYIP